MSKGEFHLCFVWIIQARVLKACSENKVSFSLLFPSQSVPFLGGNYCAWPNAKNLVSIFHAEMLNSLTFIECPLRVRTIQGAVWSTKMSSQSRTGNGSQLTLIWGDKHNSKSLRTESKVINLINGGVLE